MWYQFLINRCSNTYKIIVDTMNTPTNLGVSETQNMVTITTAV